MSANAHLQNLLQGKHGIWPTTKTENGLVRKHNLLKRCSLFIIRQHKSSLPTCEIRSNIRHCIGSLCAKRTHDHHQIWICKWHGHNNFGSYVHIHDYWFIIWKRPVQTWTLPYGPNHFARLHLFWIHQDFQILLCAEDPVRRAKER